MLIFFIPQDKLSERVGIDNRNFHICKEISLDDSTNQIKSLWADSHAKFQHLNYRSELKTRGVTIAFVSGYIGKIILYYLLSLRTFLHFKKKKLS